MSARKRFVIKSLLKSLLMFGVSIDVFQPDATTLACFGCQAAWDTGVNSLAGVKFSVYAQPQPFTLAAADARAPQSAAAAAAPLRVTRPVACAPMPPQAKLAVFRCLDTSHSQPCPFCTPAPTEAELDEFELVGEARRLTFRL